MAVQFIPIDFNTQYDLWQEFRVRGIGASSFAALVGLDKYKCNLELFNECIGYPSYSLENLRTISGRETEPITGKFYMYYDGSTKSVVDNWAKKKIIRQYEPVNAFCVNDKYEGLYVSMDGRILPYRGLVGYGALEKKNTIARALDQYENRMNPAHIVQNLIQCRVSEYNFGEIAIYEVDSGQFDVIELHDLTPHKEIVDNWMEMHRIFWANVKVARGHYTAMIDCQMKMNFRKAAEHQAEIEKLEPPAQNTDLYLSYLNKNYKNRIANKNVGIVKGTPEQYEMAKIHKDIKKQIAELEVKMRKEEISLKTAIGGANKMDFGKGQGYLSWTPTSSGTRPFLNKVI